MLSKRISRQTVSLVLRCYQNTVIALTWDKKTTNLYTNGGHVKIIIIILNPYKQEFTIHLNICKPAVHVWTELQIFHQWSCLIGWGVFRCSSQITQLRTLSLKSSKSQLCYLPHFSLALGSEVMQSKERFYKHLTFMLQSWAHCVLNAKLGPHVLFSHSSHTICICEFI